MRTSKNKNIFTRQLHPNRNLMWAIALIVIAGLALSSYIYVTSQNSDFDSVFASLGTKKIFVDNNLRYLVSYPKNWVIEKDPSGSTVFDNPANNSETITVSRADLKSENSIRQAFKIQKETNATLPGRQISFLAVDSNGSSMQVAIIKTALNLFYVSGNSAYFRPFVLNMRFF